MFTSLTRAGLAACATLAALGLAAPAASASVVTRNVNVTLNAANLDSYNLDVNLDGTTDFTFQSAYSPDPALTVGFDQIAFPFASTNGAVIDTQTGDGFPPVSLLALGNTVSASSLFSSANDNADLYFFDTLDPVTGNFGGKTGYVGLRFTSGGQTNYGFAQVTVVPLNAAANQFNLTIGTVGYETVAGRGIQIGAAPEPSQTAALGLGVLGIAGLALKAHRRKSIAA